MKKLFGLWLLALIFLLPSAVEAANRFAICATTCTWDNTSTAMWSTSSGGATGASAPGSSDAVIIDAATCTGGTTCTITTFSGTITVQTITWGTCTASTTGCIIDASVNNTNFTLSSTGSPPFSGTGTGTRKWLAGTGTYSITQTGANSPFDMTTTTNDQGSTFSGATWTVSGATTGNRTWQGGGFSFGPLTINTNSSRGVFTIQGANTWSSMTIGAPAMVSIGATQTISGALATSGGSASAPVLIMGSSTTAGFTISLGSAVTPQWVGIRAMTTSGAGNLVSTSCIDYGQNTFANSGSCTFSVGGGGRIIGG